MASSKLQYSLLASQIVRNNLHKTSNHINPIRFHSSSAAVHPWPEWVEFVNTLKSKGYIGKKCSYTNSHLLPPAGLAFAHHRFDLLESLSLVDIKTLVQRCPNLLRRVVDSSKRLREHLHVKERKVCDACILRQHCHRSYHILADYEASARTVDVIRILIAYALDPALLSEGTVSSDTGIVEKSVRRLLSQVVELSHTLPAPEIPITSVPAPRLKREPHMSDENDWKCSRCNFMNFERDFRCKQCQGDGPRRIDSSVKMRFGEWMCEGCGLLHYARKTSCFRCKATRPVKQLRPGDWECPSCTYLNFRNNISCRKCNCDRPQPDGTFSSQTYCTANREIG